MSLNQLDVDESKKSAGDTAAVQVEHNSTLGSDLSLAVPRGLNVWTKLDLLVLPIVFMIYLISALVSLARFFLGYVADVTDCRLRIMVGSRERRKCEDRRSAREPEDL